MDENPDAWDYVFMIKMPRMLYDWKATLKRDFEKYQTDWERFWQLDPRADALHYAACAFYWETEESKAISDQCKTNRLKNKWDHHLGSSGYSQLDHKHKQKLSLDQVAKYSLGTFHPKYDKEDKKRKNLEKVDSLSHCIKQATIQHQSSGELDPSRLPPDVQNFCVVKVFGPTKKNRLRFRGDVIPNRAKSDASSSTSGINMRTGIGGSTGPTIRDLMRAQRESNKKIQELKAQNQVFLEFIMEQHPDKVATLNERMNIALGSVGNSNEGQEAPGSEETNEDWESRV